MGDRRQRPRGCCHVRAADGRPAAVPSRTHPACRCLVTLGALVKPTACWRCRCSGGHGIGGCRWSCGLTAILAYLPYLSVGSGVFGYLWGYVEEEGLASGRGINLLWLMERFTGPVPRRGRGLRCRRGVGPDRPGDRRCISQGPLGMGCGRLPRLAARRRSWCSSLPTIPGTSSSWSPSCVCPSATAWVLTLACPLLYDSIPGAGWPGYDARIAVFMLATVAALAHDAWSMRRKSRKLTSRSRPS